MSSPEELQNDPEFMASTPADQIAYLSHVDPEFKASHPDDQAEYLAHVTKQPAVPEEKGALKTAWDYYTKPKQAPVMKPFAPPAPSKPAPIELGEQDQQTEAELESQAGVPFHPSQKGFEQLSEALGKFGGKVTEGLAQGLTETPVTGFEQDVPEHVSKEEFEKQHPKYAGAAQAVGEFVGSMAADPRMYAFALLPGAEAAPLINALVSGAFAVDMGKAQVERAKDLGEHWDSMTEQERYKEMTQLGLSSVLAGMAGAHAVEGTPAALKQAGDVGIGTVQAAGRGAQAVVPHSPGVAAALGAAHGLTRGVSAAYFEGKGAGYASKYLAEPLERGANAMATFKMSPEDRNVELLTVDSGKADKAVEKAIAAHSKYEASEAKGAIDPEANPAYKKSLDAVNKAREAQAEAHYHLQEARDAAAAAKEAGAARPEREITPAETALARPDQPTPTDEELKARQEKLMSQIEEKAGVEKPAPVPENVKVPGQVQPETFPQEPTAAPRVDETTQMRPLGDNKGVIMGRPPRLLTEGVPEPAPEAPKGEILPPEKPVKPGRLGALKVGEGGKVIDTEDELQRKIEEGLQGTPKPVAMRPLGAPEETKAPLGGKIEVPQTEAPKYTKKYADTLVDNLHKSIPDAEISIVGSVKRAGESAHDVDLLASEKDMPSITSAMEEQGFKEISGSSNVSPKEAKEAGKEFPTDQWSRVHHFENEEGHKVEVWHKDTSPVEKPTTGHLTDENRRALEHRIGKSNLDLLDSPEGIEAARRFIRGTNKQYADLANTFKIEGGSGENGTWKPEDFKRSRAEHGGELSPKKEAIIKELRNYLPDHADLMEATKEWGPNVESYGAPAGGIDNAHEATVKEGGGEYKGVQEGVPEAGLKGLVLFDHPETHSSLALPEDEVTPEAVRAKLEAHKEAWDKAEMEPIPATAEDLKAQVTQPFRILGQEEKVAPEVKAVSEPKVNPAPAEPRPALDRTKIQGGDVAQPHTNYHEASQAEGNPWVRRSLDPANDAQPTNEKRTLLVQFASELLQKDTMNDDAKAYYDKLYSGAREGYARMRDFWEIPQWMSFASHILPDADVYVVRDMDSAKEFLNKAGYGHVAFSALDVNTPHIEELAKSYPGKFDVGGYIKPESLLKGNDNIRWHDNMESFAKEHGVEYKNG